MHSACGQDHDPASACPPPAVSVETRTEWGVLADENQVALMPSRLVARDVAKDWDSVVLTRTITIGPWTEVAPGRAPESTVADETQGSGVVPPNGDSRPGESLSAGRREPA
jgi:hypothetical protein